MVLKGYIYTIAVDNHASHLAFSTILPCVLHQNAVHFAPKRSVFCTKTQCILQQNAVYLAAKRSAFSGKTPETGCKRRSF